LQKRARRSTFGYTAGLDVELATLLQTAAWKTAQDDFKP
jgi:hypothetical protein